MTDFILLKGKNHYSCMVFQESNNFGDQRLCFRYETVLGVYKYHHETCPEGNWIDTKEMLRIAKSAFKAVWNT